MTRHTRWLVLAVVLTMAVPINGLVKSVGIDNPNTIELVAFGDSGATSELP